MSNTSTITISKTVTCVPPAPAPRPPPPPPPPPPYSLTETCFDSPTVIADMVTCKCKDPPIHQFKVRTYRHPKMKIQSPRESNARIPQVTFYPQEFKESEWSHTVELVPCWHYHFKSDGSIHFMSRCPHRQSETKDLNLVEKCLEANTVETLIGYLGKDKIDLWPEAIKKRFGHWTLNSLVKVLKDGLTSVQKMQLIKATFDEKVVSVLQKQNENRIVGNDITKLRDVLFHGQEEEARKQIQSQYLNRLFLPPFDG